VGNAKGHQLQDLGNPLKGATNCRCLLASHSRPDGIQIVHSFCSSLMLLAGLMVRERTFIPESSTFLAVGPWTLHPTCGTNCAVHQEPAHCVLDQLSCTISTEPCPAFLVKHPSGFVYCERGMPASYHRPLCLCSRIITRVVLTGPRDLRRAYK
jgi:hypothetical protein